MLKPPITTTSPTTRKITIAPTLRIAAQNSNSPNARADSRLITSTTARAMSTVAQVGMIGNQNCTYSPTAESSAMPGERPVQPVHPAGDEGPLLAVELAHVGHEGARGGAVQHELAERAHQEVGDDADDGVADQQRRAVVVQAGRRAEEQAGADRAADGDHLDVPAAQGLLVAGLFGVESELCGSWVWVMAPSCSHRGWSSPVS